jgi:membrane protein
MKRARKKVVAFVKETFSDFAQDEAVTRAAALAFYTGLSFAPMLLLAIAAVGIFGPDASDAVVAQVHGLLGPEAGRAAALVVENAEDRPKGGWIGAVLGLVTILFSAAGAFGELQSSLNRIWEVKARPGLGIRGWIRKRLLSVGMVLAVVFLLVVSLAFSAVLSFLFAGRTGFLWEVLNAVTSLVAFTLLFGLLFKYVPDVKVPWHVLRIGAVTTAVLFLLGKTGIGLYLGRSAVGSSYGAAGSLVVLLVWVYYCSIVVFLGAEATQTQARLQGLRIEPNRFAVRFDEDAGSGTSA